MYVREGKNVRPGVFECTSGSVRMYVREGSMKILQCIFIFYTIH